MINAGLFNKRISILGTSDEVVYDSEGYPLEPREFRHDVWAMVKPLKAQEYIESKATHSENITRFVIRYTKEIDSTMTIRYKNEDYEIESIINDNEADITLTLIGRLVKQNG